MSKPVRDVDIVTANGKKSLVSAVLDTGSFYSIIREDCLPHGAVGEKLKVKEKFGTAKRRGGKLVVTAVVNLKMRVEGHWISDEVKVAADLVSEMLIGAKTMQSWDITIKNRNGSSTIHIGHDLNDPDIQTVL